MIIEKGTRKTMKNGAKQRKKNKKRKSKSLKNKNTEQNGEEPGN